MNEKFFSLCRKFGARNVGILTGDVSANYSAPVICCTQEVLANQAGLHWTYVGSVERGERNVSIDNMCRLAWALGVELPQLLRPLR